MPYKSRCHYHYIDPDDSVTATEVANEYLEPGSYLLKWTDCGHIDFPLDATEKSESYIKEKRNYPISIAQLYMNSLDFP